MALWPVMGMLDRISEHAVTICMLGSYRWCYNASKSCSHTHTLVHTDQDDLSPGQPIGGQGGQGLGTFFHFDLSLSVCEKVSS